MWEQLFFLFFYLFFSGLSPLFCVRLPPIYRWKILSFSLIVWSPNNNKNTLVPHFFSFAFWSLCSNIFYFLFVLFFLFFEKGNVNSIRKINNFENNMLKAEKKFEIVVVVVKTTTTTTIIILITNSINSNDDDDDDSDNSSFNVRFYRD